MPMTLCYVFPEPLPLPRARGLQAIRTVDALAREGVAVQLAYAAESPEDPFAAYGLAQPRTVELLRLSRRLVWPLQRIHSNRFFMARLARRLRLQRPDAVMVRHLKAAAMFARSFADIPMLYEAHEIFADTAPVSKRAGHRALEQQVVGAAAGIVTNSGATAERLAALYGGREKMTVIPNGVEWPQALPSKSWNDAALHVIYAGSFFGWKGAADLVAAGALLPGHKITLIGGEPEQIERLRAGTASAQAELSFIERVPHAQVMAALAQACVAVLPNRAEPDSAFTSPIKLFEYMASGCAVVASDLPALREILAPDEAVWFPAGDVPALAAAIRSLCADPARARALGERAREKARRYTWQARAVKLKTVLEQIARRPGTDK
jgi:glycosyltransferase involved in cell wall biosynthesis